MSMEDELCSYKLRSRITDPDRDSTTRYIYSQYLYTALSLIYLQALSRSPKLLQLLVPTSGFS